MDTSRDVSMEIPTVICHHYCIPVTLISDLHLLDLLMKMLSLFITHVASEVSESSQHTVPQFNVAFLLPKKFFTTIVKAFHASSSTSFVCVSNCVSVMSCRICGLSKMPAFSFSMVNPGKIWHKYMKQSPSLSRALVNCYINPSLMCNCGKMIVCPQEGC